jgi:hypothetical protein
MTEDTTRLNITRAREALARARAEHVAAAVRAPRPADLSRLQEDEVRRMSIDTRAGAFRTQLRDQLGLGEYRGPETPTSSYVSKTMSAPLCDADVCAPARPAMQTPGLEEHGARAHDDVIELEDETPAPEPKPRKKFLGIF